MKLTAVTSRTGYDAMGKVVTQTDALGQITTLEYDVKDQLIRQIDAKGGVTRFSYDAVGNLASLTDPTNNTTSYSYDALNRLSSETTALGTRSYTYDGVGNLLSVTDRDGRVRQFSYDTLNRQVAEQWKAGTTTLKTFSYGYDAEGKLIQVGDGDSFYSYGYDAGDRLTSVSNAGTLGVPTVVFSYGYDAVNNLTVATDTINGVLSGVKINNYDALNRVVRMTQSGAGVAEKRIDLAYDAASQMTSLTRYSDLAGTQLVATSDYSFDGNGRLTNLTHHRGGTVLADYGFVYDAVNRITQMTSADGVSKYDYDLTNQLTGADYNYQTDEAYSYDANGNRTNAGYGTGTYNQLLTDGVYAYEYDAEGNRTKRTEIATGEITEYLWDYRNRLTSVTTKTAAGVVSRQVNYSYDVNNQRIAKVVDLDGAGTATPTTERFVYDGEHIALTFDGAGALTERFFHGPTIDQIIAQDGPGGLVSWALADHLGTVRDVIDSNGAILNHLVYDSFGEITSETNSSVDFRFSYTGREFDGETGQYYYRARYYDAGVGEFISDDPIAFAGGDLNLSRYVKNDPLNRIDPSGLSDVRWPLNVSVVNRSKKPILVLNSKDMRDDIEVLYPGKGTPDAPGHSKDGP